MERRLTIEELEEILEQSRIRFIETYGENPPSPDVCPMMQDAFTMASLECHKLTLELEDSKQQAKLFYKQLQEAEAKLEKINQLSEVDIDI